MRKYLGLLIMKIFETYEDFYWLNIVIAVLFAILLWFAYKKWVLPSPEMEGFYQKKPFLLEQGPASYDAFYRDIYSDLYLPETNSEIDIDFFMLTNPSPSKSVVLDIGCGSGTTLQLLHDKGFNRIIGVDSSSEMIEFIEFDTRCADVTVDPMLFENNTFSHILCTQFTLYEMREKDKFFRHCFHWLVLGGYLIVHIADPTFDKTTPSSQSTNPNITETIIDFPGFLFKSEYLRQENGWIHRETFTDKQSEYIRQNERILYMEDVSVIQEIAKRNGFTIKELITPYQDPHQFLLLLFKPPCGEH